MERIDPDIAWSRSTLDRHRAYALAILSRHGVNAEKIDGGGHGSAVRDYVLNWLGHEPDSLVGLAAQLFELSSHAIALWPSPTAGLAYRLGRITLLLKVYEIDLAGQAKANRASALARGAKVRIRIRAIVDQLMAANVERRDWVDKIAPRLRGRYRLSDRQIRRHLADLGYPSRPRTSTP